MRKECEECCGTGYVDCDIEDVFIDKDHRHATELTELRSDCVRLRRQCDVLTKNNPVRKEAYFSQLNATLATVKKQAEKLYENTNMA